MKNNLEIAIINYGMGNIGSVVNAFKSLGESVIVTNDVKEIVNAKGLVLPGVGAFPRAMKNLKRLQIHNLLYEQVVVESKPFLGICLGMQLIAESSEELGGAEGLNWIKGNVVPLTSTPEYFVPHVGWNNVSFDSDDVPFGGIQSGSHFYFDHSFHFECNENLTKAWCNYGTRILSAFHKNNIIATQFHPEKSQRFGLKLLRNFLNFCDSKLDMKDHA